MMRTSSIALLRDAVHRRLVRSLNPSSFSSSSLPIPVRTITTAARRQQQIIDQSTTEPTSSEPSTDTASDTASDPPPPPPAPPRIRRSIRSPSSLASNPPPEPVPSDTGIPKQKVAMYTKILKVLRTPNKGRVPNTDGDDYVLDTDESQPNSMFSGLISANLSGSTRAGGRKKSAKQLGRAYGKGGRKSARAQVWIQRALVKGTGDFYVNGLRYVEYFTELDHRWDLCAPFYYTKTLTDFDMIAIVRGGGRSGQAGAIKHAAAKALQAYDRPRFRPMLKKKFLLSRDSRVVERKKYGQKKARKRFTFVKR